MKMIRIYRNPDCRRCARYARLGTLLDWHDRLETSTATPKTGALLPGEIVVEGLTNGNLHRGAASLDLIAGRIHLYAPVRLLLRFSSFRRYIDRELSGFGGTSCELPTATGRAEASNNRRP